MHDDTGGRRTTVLMATRSKPCAETVWSGVFGTTENGLPLIGPVSDHPRILAACGCGGNGITSASWPQS